MVLIHKKVCLAEIEVLILEEGCKAWFSKAKLCIMNYAL